MQISFDTTISLGAILNALVLLIGFAIAFTRVGGRIDILCLRIKAVEKVITETQGLDKRLIAMEVQFTYLVSELSEVRKELAGLRRGEGWIQQKRSSVDGEY